MVAAADAADPPVASSTGRMFDARHTNAPRVEYSNGTMN